MARAEPVLLRASRHRDVIHRLPGLQPHEQLLEGPFTFAFHDDIGAIL